MYILISKILYCGQQRRKDKDCPQEIEGLYYTPRKFKVENIV